MLTSRQNLGIFEYEIFGLYYHNTYIIISGCYEFYNSVCTKKGKKISNRKFQHIHKGKVEIKKIYEGVRRGMEV